MDDSQLLRYSRQILLPQVDIEGQKKLIDACVLIVGVGGLGSPAAMYLAGAGVGRIVLCDGDTVDLSNLQRQIAHNTSDIGQSKALSGKQTLQSLNSEIEVTAVSNRLEGPELEQQVKKADVVLDCSDNFPTRFSVNKACVLSNTPLVSGATIRFEGQISVFTPGENNSPCYNCLYPDIDDLAESCSQSGVIAPITGIVGSIQALEAIKLLTRIGKTLIGKVLLIDGLNMEWNMIQLPRNSGCPTCSKG